MSSINVEKVLKFLTILAIQNYDKQAELNGKMHVACQKNFKYTKVLSYNDIIIETILNRNLLELNHVSKKFK